MKLLCYLSGVVTFEVARVNLMNVLGTIGKMLIASDVTDTLEPLQVYNHTHVKISLATCNKLFKQAVEHIALLVPNFLEQLVKSL